MDCFRYESAGLWDCRNCCSSCHDDYWEYNYSACEVEVELDHWLMVCCRLTQVVTVTDLPEEFWR